MSECDDINDKIRGLRNAATWRNIILALGLFLIGWSLWMMAKAAQDARDSILRIEYGVQSPINRILGAVDSAGRRWNR